jgi:transcriptional regulator with XRE-family HTH domain
MSGFRKHLWENLKNKFFRREYVADNVRTGLAYQIKAMRSARGLSQSDLATLTGKAQSAIARLEDPDYGKFSIQTLLEIANAFDVWLSVEFVSFSVGLQRTENRSPMALNAISFSQDRESIKSQTGSGMGAVVVVSTVEGRRGHQRHQLANWVKGAGRNEIRTNSNFKLPINSTTVLPSLPLELVANGW